MEVEGVEAFGGVFTPTAGAKALRPGRPRRVIGIEED